MLKTDFPITIPEFKISDVEKVSLNFPQVTSSVQIPGCSCKGPDCPPCEPPPE